MTDQRRPEGASDTDEPVQEAAAAAGSHDNRLITDILGRAWAMSVIPLGAIVMSLLVGSVVIIGSSLAADSGFNPLAPLDAYGSLAEGALGSTNGLVNTVVAAAPLVFTGLAVGVGFKAGLFNIGATGQLLMGGFTAAVVGAVVGGAPGTVAVPVAILAGALAGAAWGFIPGFLKAVTGAHEVVITIMLNSVAAFIISGVVNDVLRAPGTSFSRTADVGNAALPILFGRNGHLGVLLAIAVVPIVYWLLWRTTLGFEIRTVGASPSAARYAGMRPGRLIILTMSMAGMFAGLAGVIQILGLTGHYPATFGTALGFDGITVALLGRAHPVGILFGALLLGGMRAGAPLMQIRADIPIEIIDVIQAVILLFLAADVIIRYLFRVRAARGGLDELQTVTRSYGEQAAR